VCVCVCVWCVCVCVCDYASLNSETLKFALTLQAGYTGSRSLM
jgi:hypothetical protein